MGISKSYSTSLKTFVTNLSFTEGSEEPEDGCRIADAIYTAEWVLPPLEIEEKMGQKVVVDFYGQYPKRASKEAETFIPARIRCAFLITNIRKDEVSRYSAFLRSCGEPELLARL